MGQTRWIWSLHGVSLQLRGSFPRTRGYLRLQGPDARRVPSVVVGHAKVDGGFRMDHACPSILHPHPLLRCLLLGLLALLAGLGSFGFCEQER